MIKSFLIIVLTVALAVSAIVTRPSEFSARSFLASGHQPQPESPKTLLTAIQHAIIKSSDSAKDGVPHGYEFKDRVLWVEVQKDGQTVYTGLLSHWIQNEPATPSKQNDKKSDSPLAAFTTVRK